MDYLLEVNRLEKSYKKNDFNIRNISLTVQPGEVVALVGKNGCGKSTLINTLVGNRFKDNGEIKFFGEVVADSDNKHKEYLGVVFDDLRVPHKLTISEIDKAFAQIYQTWDSDQFNSLITEFDLPSNKKVKTFSRGMKMKAAIAIALAHDSRLLILDEATAGMDASGREEVLEILEDYVKEDNGIMLSSHISSDIASLATKIIFMKDGRIVLTEEKDNLFDHYGIVEQSEEEFNVPEELIVASRLYQGKRRTLVNDCAQVEGAEPLRQIDDATKLLMRGELK
ncbi:ABC transporter ATP-binding protein [Staphylococcus sp. SQ8-PEA]|uniref:ABC transporter ATP-binding protein n=1 Tax=Staphylococcus marylandisciuri TaxID=2981529 RepID=A0ABT2QQS0_9STAP|nr:ABC transporter ATP-binding protein [Staphylococcus marylandisciuri]MCU5746325.1 ABC transporter ATP-binding protein [Staphylococcus marylandisciuri]